MTDQPQVVPQQSAELDAEAVVAYLRAHPTFFAEHDELLIETAKEELEVVSRILEEEMRGAADLAVPLEVDMHTGSNWYEAK